MKTSRYSTWMTARWRDALLAKLNVADSEEQKQLSDRLAAAVVVDSEDILEGRVQFGSLVTVFSIEEEEEQSFQIVSRDEAIEGRNLLDESSPLAQALFGACEGQVVRVILENGSNCDYEVTHIRVPQ